MVSNFITVVPQLLNSRESTPGGCGFMGFTKKGDCLAEHKIKCPLNNPSDLCHKNVTDIHRVSAGLAASGSERKCHFRVETVCLQKINGIRRKNANISHKRARFD